MKTTVVGNYPKISSEKDGINLRSAINRAEKHKISEAELEEVFQKTILRTIEDQVTAGVDVITDGQIRWLDLVHPLTRSVGSIHPGGLLRFFDNNIYYRRPQIVDLLTRDKDIVTDEYVFAQKHSKKPVKTVLCGPITFCDFSDNFYYKSFDKLADAVSDILAEEVAELAAAGCEHIQIDEPALPLYPHKLEMASRLYQRIFAGASDASTGIAIYFTSIKAIAEPLFELPVKFFLIDLVSHPDDLQEIRHFGNEGILVAGLFDGRNIMVENEKTIRGKLDQISDHVPYDRIILSPSCGLEFLPQKYAVAKMTKMSEIASKLSPAEARK